MLLLITPGKTPPVLLLPSLFWQQYHELSTPPVLLLPAFWQQYQELSTPPVLLLPAFGSTIKSYRLRSCCSRQRSGSMSKSYRLAPGRVYNSTILQLATNQARVYSYRLSPGAGLYQN